MKRIFGACALTVLALLSAVTIHACTPADRAAATEHMHQVTAACCYAKKGLPVEEIKRVCAVEEAAAPFVDAILQLAGESAGAP